MIKNHKRTIDLVLHLQCFWNYFPKAILNIQMPHPSWLQNLSAEFAVLLHAVIGCWWLPQWILPSFPFLWLYLCIPVCVQLPWTLLLNLTKVSFCSKLDQFLCLHSRHPHDSRSLLFHSWSLSITLFSFLCLCLKSLTPCLSYWTFL